MNLKEVLVECGRLQDFPKVKTENRVRNTLSNIGKIQEVNTRGVAVRFSGLTYNKWFAWEHGTDKRSHYASELTFYCSSDVLREISTVSDRQSIATHTKSWQCKRTTEIGGVASQCKNGCVLDSDQCESSINNSQLK
jgi:hypothetical protein